MLFRLRLYRPCLLFPPKQKCICLAAQHHSVYHILLRNCGCTRVISNAIYATLLLLNPVSYVLWETFDSGVFRCMSSPNKTDLYHTKIKLLVQNNFLQCCFSESNITYILCSIHKFIHYTLNKKSLFSFSRYKHYSSKYRKTLKKFCCHEQILSTHTSMLIEHKTSVDVHNLPDRIAAVPAQKFSILGPYETYRWPAANRLCKPTWPKLTLQARRGRAHTLPSVVYPLAKT